MTASRKTATTGSTSSYDRRTGRRVGRRPPAADARQLGATSLPRFRRPGTRDVAKPPPRLEVLPPDDPATRSERHPRRAPNLSHGPHTEPRALHAGTTVAGDGEASSHRPDTGEMPRVERPGFRLNHEDDPRWRDRHAVDVPSPPMRQRVTQPPPLRPQRCGTRRTSSSERAPTLRWDFLRAAEGTRTLDLLHGKQTL
jgi:hypothetical protein